MLGFCLAATYCTPKPENNVVQYLTNGSKKHWTLITEHPIKRYIGQSFNIDGTYTLYSISDDWERIKRKLRFKPTWELINDSTIADGAGVNFKIEYINDDVLILNSLNFKEVMVLLKAKDQKTEPVADTTDHSMDL